MAVTAFTEIQDDNGGSAQLDGGIVRVAYSRSFRVETSDPLDGSQVVMTYAATASPLNTKIGEFYVSGNDIDTDAILFAYAPSRQGPKLWTLVCKYETPRQNPEAVDNPLSKPPEWSGTWNQTEQVAEVDIEGTYVRNSAKQKPDPPLMKIVSSGSFVIQRNELTIPKAFSDYRDVINANTVQLGGLTFEPKSLRLANVTFRRAFFGMMEYYQVTYSLEARTGQYFLSDYGDEEGTIGWDEMVPDIGRQQLVSGELKQCVDKNKQPVSDAVALNSNGTQKTAGSDPDFYRWQLYEDVDFSVLGIG